MKVNLDQELKNFDGTNLSGISVKAIMIQYLGTYGSQEGKKVIAAYKLGTRVYDASGEIELSDSELDIMRDSLQKPQHIAIVYAQICDVFNVNGDNDVVGANEVSRI